MKVISWTEQVQNRMWVRQRSYGVLWYMSWDRRVWDYQPFNYHCMAGNLKIEHAIRILCCLSLPNASVVVMSICVFAKFHHCKL